MHERCGTMLDVLIVDESVSDMITGAQLSSFSTRYSTADFGAGRCEIDRASEWSRALTVHTSYGHYDQSWLILLMYMSRMRGHRQ
jgi:hypothetical protein